MRIVRISRTLPSLSARGGRGGFTAGALVVLVCALAVARAARADSAAADAQIPPEYRLTNVLPLPGPPSPAALSRIGLGLDSSAGYAATPLTGPEPWGVAPERSRAALGYAWSPQQSWGLKFGMAPVLDPLSGWQRFAAPSFDRLHASTLPALHLSGESRLDDRWLVSLSADGLHTARGQGLDMDLRVDYSLTRDLQFFGSYRVTDSGGGDGFELYGYVPSNSARVGVRLRF